MALTELQIIDRVISRLAESGVENPTIYGPEIPAWISEALYRVAVKNSSAPEFLKIVTGLSIASGVLTNTDTTLILDEIQRVTVNTTPAYRAPSYDALRGSLGTDVIWFAVEGQVLNFRATDGTLGSLSSSANVTIVAPTVPLLANLPARFEPALVEELVQIGVEAKRIQFPQKVEVAA